MAKKQGAGATEPAQDERSVFDQGGTSDPPTSVPAAPAESNAPTAEDVPAEPNAPTAEDVQRAIEIAVARERERVCELFGVVASRWEAFAQRGGAIAVVDAASWYVWHGYSVSADMPTYDERVAAGFVDPPELPSVNDLELLGAESEVGAEPEHGATFDPLA